MSNEHVLIQIIKDSEAYSFGHEMLNSSLFKSSSFSNQLYLPRSFHIDLEGPH